MKTLASQNDQQDQTRPGNGPGGSCRKTRQPRVNAPATSAEQRTLEPHQRKEQEGSEKHQTKIQASRTRPVNGPGGSFDEKFLPTTNAPTTGNTAWKAMKMLQRKEQAETEGHLTRSLNGK